MTDETTETSRPDAPADETFEFTAEPESGATARTTAREWLGQLQSMIEGLAEQAAPVVREVGAKAAELAALAGDKAGPVAQRAAELTAEAGQKFAVRSRDFAAEMRRDLASHPGDGAEAPEAAEEAIAEEEHATVGDAP